MNQETLCHATVGFLTKHNRVNLPVKKRKTGAGFRNGYGGKIWPEETPSACVTREILEEGRIKTWPQDLRRIALLHCHNRTETGEKFLYVVHVFETTFWLGEPKETEEMGPPAWFPTDALPLDELMIDDRLWLPRFFRDRKPLVVTVKYGPNQATLDEEMVIEEVLTLPEE